MMYRTPDLYRCRVSLAIIALSIGCYRPALEQACEVSCTEGACPGALVCGDGDNRCHAPGTPQCFLQPAEAGVEDGGPQPACYGVDVPPFMKICPPTVVPPLTYNTITINTSSQCMFMQSQADPDALKLCVIASERITIDGAVTAIGPFPLVLLSTSSLDIAPGAMVDVASKRLAGTVGTGANDASCAPRPGTSPQADAGAGGGAGGSFQQKGGNGGAGENGTVAGGIASAGVVRPVTFRGGCPGGAGGAPLSNAGKPGANGGGAVYLIANTMMTINGTINASGAGGATAGNDGQGGPGGGSGGMIGLVAGTSIKLGTNAKVFALGGGGSSGGRDLTVGVPGNDPTSPVMAGIGGNDAGSAGDGGNGGVPFPGGLGTDATATNNLGGGGGGGTAGFIFASPAPALPTAGTVNPPFTP